MSPGKCCAEARDNREGHPCPEAPADFRKEILTFLHQTEGDTSHSPLGRCTNQGRDRRSCLHGPFVGQWDSQAQSDRPRNLTPRLPFLRSLPAPGVSPQRNQRGERRVKPAGRSHSCCAPSSFKPKSDRDLGQPQGGSSCQVKGPSGEMAALGKAYMCQI